MRLTWIAESKIAANYEHNPSDDQLQLLHLASSSALQQNLQLLLVCHYKLGLILSASAATKYICSAFFNRAILDYNTHFTTGDSEQKTVGNRIFVSWNL